MLRLFMVVLLLTETVLGSVVTKTPDVSLYLEVFQEMLQGPLSGKVIVLYLDPGLDGWFVDRVLTLLALEDSTYFLVDVGSDGALWCQHTPVSVLRGADLIHVVVFQGDTRSFFEEVSLHWNPKYLIFFNVFDQSFQTLLTDIAFTGIERLVLLERLTSSFQTRSLKTAVITSFPFSKFQPIKILGIWNLKTFSTYNDIFVDRFQSFEGYEFRLGTWFDDSPYLYQSKTEAEGIGEGVEVEMLDSMARAFHYTYNLTVQPPDEQWGSFENGSWNGMLGMVHRKEKNFTVNYFVITEERLEAFDASVSYWMEGFGLAMLSPRPLAKWRGIYYPFMSSVWLCLSLTFVLAVSTMTIQEWAEEEPLLGGVGRTWPYLLRPVVSHSLPLLPTSHWQRVFVGTWWLYCFILTTAYTANLIAFLTIPVFPERIQTVQQLAQSDYRVSMCDYGEFVPGALRSSENPHYRTLGQKLDLFPEYEGAIRPMQRGTHAFIESFSYSRILLYVDFRVTNAYMLREQLYPGHLCWYFQKNTAWKYKFDHGIQRLVEAGLIQHWLKTKSDEFLGRDHESREGYAVEQQDDKRSLSLEHLQGAFFILLLTWVAAAAVFTLVLLHHQCCSGHPSVTTHHVLQWSP